MKAYHLYVASCVKNGGILHYIYKSGKLQKKGKVTCDRPMYLHLRNGSMQVLLRQPFLNNQNSGIISYDITKDGKLKQNSRIIDTKGIVACHLCYFHEKTYVTNYLSGSIFCTSGKMDIHEGKGKNPVRQDMPHPHYIAPAPDGKCLLSTDLGLDAIYSYDEELNVLSVSKVPLGHGARHLAYSEDGKTVFCANELKSTVTVFNYDNGRLVPYETVPVLAREKDSTVAAIRVKGNYVYVSNRGDDSISCLYWDGKKLELCSVTPCGGASPRDFLIVEEMLICANEKGNNVMFFSLENEKVIDIRMKEEIEVPLCIAAIKI